MQSSMILADIRKRQDAMSANDQKLSEFIQKNAPLLRDYSSQQLAEAVGISQSSVVKFSQKMGYKGYPALKMAISEEIARTAAGADVVVRTPAPAKPLENNDDSLFSLLASTKEWVFKEIEGLNPEKVMLDVVRIVEGAKRIQFISAGGFSLGFKDFALKLLVAGKTVVAENDLFMQRAGIASMKRGDVLFALSLSGTNNHVVELAELAREAGVTIISLTGYNVTPLTLCADYNLYIYPENDKGLGDLQGQDIVARVALQHVIDCLYLTLLRRNTYIREQFEASKQSLQEL